VIRVTRFRDNWARGFIRKDTMRGTFKDSCEIDTQGPFAQHISLLAASGFYNCLA